MHDPLERPAVQQRAARPPRERQRGRGRGRVERPGAHGDRPSTARHPHDHGGEHDRRARGRGVLDRADHLLLPRGHHHGPDPPDRGARGRHGVQRPGARGRDGVGRVRRVHGVDPLAAQPRAEPRAAHDLHGPGRFGFEVTSAGQTVEAAGSRWRSPTTSTSRPTGSRPRPSPRGSCSFRSGEYVRQLRGLPEPRADPPSPHDRLHPGLPGDRAPALRQAAHDGEPPGRGRRADPRVPDRTALPDERQRPADQRVLHGLPDPEPRAPRGQAL